MSNRTFVWKGEVAARELKAILLEALLDAAEATVTEAQELAPLDTGALRSSGRVTVGVPPDAAAVYAEAVANPGTRDPQRPALSPGDGLVVFASFNTPYARRLHENLDWKPSAVGRKGRPKNPVGGPKYLERAAVKTWANFDAILRLVKREHGVS